MEQPEQQPEVLKRFANGELDAFEELFRGSQSEVYGWVVRIVRDPGVAEDLTVEAFWRIYQARARFDPARSFGAWARRIATNVALDHLKGAGRKANAEVDFREDTVSTLRPDPGIQQDLRERMALAFGQLPAKLRVVAMLAVVEETPHKEIAEALASRWGR